MFFFISATFFFYKTFVMFLIFFVHFERPYMTFGDNQILDCKELVVFVVLF